ncbi:MAG: replicative DNA helicase [Kiritimatiellaeota bacterium]|nr:replicative DNA helicase [Kiritimatiellota bacterium]
MSDMPDKKNKKWNTPPPPIEDLAGNTSRVPPHSAEAENAILGAILLDAPRTLEVCDNANITPESFWITSNRVLFDLIRKMNGAGKPVDAVTVADELKKEGTFDEIGGLEQIERLIDNAPIVAHTDYYSSILHEKHLLRKIIGASVAAMSKCYEPDRSTELILSETEQDILSISDGKKDAIPVFDVAVHETFGKIDKLLSRKDGLSGLSTGFKNIDDKLFGMRPSEMIVLAARPSMGKTSLAMNICENLALGADTGSRLDSRPRVPVGIFSCEMSTEALITRMLCSRAKVELQSAMKGFISPKEANQRLSKAASDYLKAPIFIDDSGGLDVMDLRARARRMKKRHNIGFLMIDYLQLLGSRSHAAQGRQLETSNISANIKAMAKELEIPVMVLSQLSRKPEDEKDGRPRISHLRDSGSIEQDADVVMMLWRPSYYQKKPDDGGAVDNTAKLDIGKNRNGAVGVANLVFESRYTQFYDAAPEVGSNDNDAD